MSRTSWSIAVLILVLALAGAVFLIRNQGAAAPDAAQHTGSGNAAVGANGVSYVVTYTDDGFSPSPVTVLPGTTVTWSNQSSHVMWVETTGPGGDCGSAQAFNSCKKIGTGGSYSHTFKDAGTYPYFNQEHSQDTGIVIVNADASAGPINPNAQPE